MKKMVSERGQIKKKLLNVSFFTHKIPEMKTIIKQSMGSVVVGAGEGADDRGE